MENKTVKKLLRNPVTDKPRKEVFIVGKGWFVWNSVWKVYNSKINYEQLTTKDLAYMLMADDQ